MKRRSFLKLSCGLGAGLSLTALGVDVTPVQAYAADASAVDALRAARQSTTVCCYCSVGCGIICSTDTRTNAIINTEGDPEHPINQGTLCAKGAALYQTSSANPHRLKKVLHRKPGSTEWEQVSWDFAINRIAELIKKERDASFIEKNEHGQLVNRVQSLSLMGSSNVLNEECWVTTQFSRSLGFTYLDHQARV